MTDEVAHPAKFTEVILDVIGDLVLQEAARRPVRVLDPFAGTGKIHELHHPPNVKTFGVELEPEWARQHVRTVVGNALYLSHLPICTEPFEVIATSPTYGNRMADHHEAKDKSKRMTYRHQLGRMPHRDSSTTLGWGPKYWDFHARAWDEVNRVIAPDGLFILNVKNFYRTKRVKGVKVVEEVDVCKWHLDFLTDMGYHCEASVVVPVRGMRMGANHTKRVNHEMVYALRKDAPR